MIEDSIGQEVNLGDLCILPWKSNKVTLGFYSHETSTKYIFTSRRNGTHVNGAGKVGVYRSLVNKWNGHFIRVADTEISKYIL